MRRGVLPFRRPNYSHLVNLQNPLNEDLVVWLLCLPEVTAGTTWANLLTYPTLSIGVPQYNGVLNNFASPQTTTSGFNVSTRPNSNGHLAFDGSNDYVDLGLLYNGAGSVAGDGDFTMAMWVNIVSNLGGFDTLLSQGRAGQDFDFLMNPSGILSFYINAGAHHIDSTTALSAGTWYHIGYTYAETGTLGSPTNALTSYVNGKAEATGGDNIWRSTSALVTCWLGGAQSYTRPLNAKMDDVRLYKRCLSAGEMYALYDAHRFDYAQVLERSYHPLRTLTGQGSAAVHNLWWAWSRFGRPLRGF